LLQSQLLLALDQQALREKQDPRVRLGLKDRKDQKGLLDQRVHQDQRDLKAHPEKPLLPVKQQ
jgi:hypothetical protein